jgi:hypothetical protein
MLVSAAIFAAAMLLTFSGCSGYQNGWLYPQNVRTVYVEMFDTTSFRRGYEFTLTDAVCKRIESQTPYKIVSDRQRADTILSGTLSIQNTVLSVDRYTGRPLEYETGVIVTVTWKDLRTGRILLDNAQANAAEDYSDAMGQTIDYSLSRAVNKAAVQVVELMEIPW